MSDSIFTLYQIGVIRSPITDLSDAPKQGDEGGVEAWIDINPQYNAALSGIAVGDELIILTWFHLSERDVLQVHPRSRPENQVTGVFATRSPVRPNPIGLHRVTVLEIDGTTLKITPMEAINGTPVVDIKSVLSSRIDER